MIHTENLTLSFGGTTLFEDVNVKFLPGNCYGLIGANGAGKSTFLKILSGDIDPSSGAVRIEPNKRIAVLKQNQFEYDEFPVLDTVLMGHAELYKIYAELESIYAKTDMTDEDGLRAGELAEQYGELDGYTAEANAAKFLSELGIVESLHKKTMEELESGQKVRVLLAQALFGDPDILLLDEPTNQLDYHSVLHLENFLMNFENTVIVISHNRHFLNKVCTHIADLDFKQIKTYLGNYDFWEKSSQLAAKQRKDQTKKNEEKIKELEDFVRRFSANASKSKQATSRKKLIEKLRPEDMPTSSRQSPFIQIKPKRPCGGDVLTVEKLSHSINGERVLSNVSFTMHKEDKIGLVGQNSLSKTILLEILAGNIVPDSGTVSWGSTISPGYFPKDNSDFFDSDTSLINWLTQYDTSDDVQYVRGLLGRMLFSGDAVLKMTKVLSGGEKARAMFSKLMITEANTLLLDEPADHLDLESISALNDGLIAYPEPLIVASHDFELMNTVVNRIMEVTPNGFFIQDTTFDDYMQSPEIQERRRRSLGE
jgi:ATPase subunit of ABC transporter with duplicated ATPase domains